MRCVFVTNIIGRNNNSFYNQETKPGRKHGSPGAVPPPLSLRCAPSLIRAIISNLPLSKSTMHVMPNSDERKTTCKYFQQKCECKQTCFQVKWFKQGVMDLSLSRAGASVQFVITQERIQKYEELKNLPKWVSSMCCMSSVNVVNRSPHPWNWQLLIRNTAICQLLKTQGSHMHAGRYACGWRNSFVNFRYEI